MWTPLICFGHVNWRALSYLAVRPALITVAATASSRKTGCQANPIGLLTTTHVSFIRFYKIRSVSITNAHKTPQNQTPEDWYYSKFKHFRSGSTFKIQNIGSLRITACGEKVAQAQAQSSSVTENNPRPTQAKSKKASVCSVCVPQHTQVEIPL